MARTIKLMADYDSWPLWWAGTESPGNIDPSTLPLDQETLAALNRWAAAFDATLDRDNPIRSSFHDMHQQQAWEHEGIRLWRRLRRELEPSYKVLYYSSRTHQVLDEPEQIDHEF